MDTASRVLRMVPRTQMHGSLSTTVAPCAVFVFPVVCSSPKARSLSAFVTLLLTLLCTRVTYSMYDGGGGRSLLEVCVRQSPSTGSSSHLKRQLSERSEAL